MILADDRNWDGVGWGFRGNGIAVRRVKVYCYYPPYSILPYCKHLNESYKGARPELYKICWPTRPVKLLTDEEVLKNPERGCCSTCSNIKRAYEKGSIKL